MLNVRKWQSGSALLIGLGIANSVVAPLLMSAPTLAQSTFNDTQGNWAEGCIVELSRQGIISGYPDGSFRPNAPVTRAEYAAMVGKAFPNSLRTSTPIQFVDVPSNYWAYNAIKEASQTGFLSGYPGSVFNPNQNIPRAQVLVSLASGLNYTPTQPATATLSANFADANVIPTYAQNAIAAATEKRLVVNYPNVRSLSPNQLASRAEVAAFLCQAKFGPEQALIPQQYIAGATATTSTRLANGTSIPARYSGAERIIVSPQEKAPLALTVAQDIRDAQGKVIIPAGSQVVGLLQPANGGSQFVAREVIINDRRIPISATSDVITSTKNVRDANLTTILKDAVFGSAAAAAIAGVTGDRTIEAREVLTGTAVGAAVGANQNRKISSTLRDAILGAATAAGIAGVTGDRTITAGEIIGGAATGATIGGVADRRTSNKVVVINPDNDLNLRLNNDLVLP